jgi:hypothetical protein
VIRPSSDLFLPGEYESNEEELSEATLEEGLSAQQSFRENTAQKLCRPFSCPVNYK